jgi:RNA polymerase sigma-70 factor, ECF subfamily
MTRKRKATDPSTAATPGRADEPPGTLGSLLFADRCRARIPEQQWVDLVQAIGARDEAALRALYEHSHRIVFALTMRLVQNRQTAEELTVDVFHDVWRRAPAYDAANGPVLGWMLNQARSRAIDRIRYEQRRKRVNRLPQDPLDGLDGEAQDEALSREALARQLRQAVGRLTADERQAIETTFFSGLTHAEAAAELQLPLGTLKSRIRSGLGKLREHIADE